MNRYLAAAYRNTPVTYFLVSCDAMAVKIGLSNALGVRRRISQVRIGTPSRRMWFAYMRGNYELEMHERFHNLRIRGEWFSLKGELLDFLSLEYPDGFIKKDEPQTTLFDWEGEP